MLRRRGGDLVPHLSKQHENLGRPRLSISRVLHDRPTLLLAFVGIAVDGLRNAAFDPPTDRLVAISSTLYQQNTMAQKPTRYHGFF